MTTYRKILLIADLPEDERPLALERLTRIADPGAEVDVISFVHEKGLESLEYHAADEARGLKKKLLDQRQEWLIQQVKNVDMEGITLKPQVVWSRDVSAWINDHADRGYDLVVKTGRRTESLWHRPMDWQLIDWVRLPIYIASTRQWKTQPSVLATIDIAKNTEDQKALNAAVTEAAVDMAERLDSELHLAYVIQVNKVLFELEAKSKHDYLQHYEKHHKQALHDFAARYDVPLKNTHVKVGQAKRKIPSIANRIKAEIVVVGRSVTQPAAGLIFGSTAERILTELRTDVLSIPTPSG